MQNRQHTTKRKHPRFQVVAPVVIESEEYGVFQGLAINISAGGVFIQTYDPLPLGTRITLGLGEADGFLVTGVVRSHYYMTYKSLEEPASFTGMGIKFTDFMNSPLEPRPFPMELIN